MTLYQHLSRFGKHFWQFEAFFADFYTVPDDSQLQVKPIQIGGTGPCLARTPWHSRFFSFRSAEVLTSPPSPFLLLGFWIESSFCLTSQLIHLSRLWPRRSESPSEFQMESQIRQKWKEYDDGSVGQPLSVVVIWGQICRYVWHFPIVLPTPGSWPSKIYQERNLCPITQLWCDLVKLMYQMFDLKPHENSQCHSKNWGLSVRTISQCCYIGTCWLAQACCLKPVSFCDVTPPDKTDDDLICCKPHEKPALQELEIECLNDFAMLQHFACWVVLLQEGAGVQTAVPFATWRLQLGLQVADQTDGDLICLEVPLPTLLVLSDPLKYMKWT